MLRKSILIVTLLLLLTSASFAQQTDAACENEYSEPSIGISFCMPAEWITVKRDYAKFKVAYGKKSNGGYPTINLMPESFKGKLSDFVTAGVNVLLTKSIKETKNGNSLKIESRTTFTAGKLQGYKIVINSVGTDGSKMRTIQYAFSGKGDTKFVITATAAQAGKAETDKVFDDIMKTLKIKK
ncbi:MAG TPA: hypothetical protein VNB22_04720 [Pyrinomonadaceae bacterium]|nr:hypothetical protein [Pyrinomonadaceae bacterium]